jgi:malate permease and related proteins
MSFNLLLSTFANNILPIILISGVGFLLGKLITVDSRTLGRVVFYLFSPLLIFDLLLKSKLDYQQAITTIAYTATVIATLCVLAFLFGKLLRLKRPMLLAVIITVAFGNTGNYGLPLISFAFGEQALAYASIYFVTTTILLNTVGVLIASLGHMDLKTALLGLFKVPLIYAVALALILNSTGFILPAAFVRTIDLAAGGSIPLMLVLLGLELTRVEWTNSLRALGLGAFLRLIAGPIVGILLTKVYNIHGAARSGDILQASMPAAVATTVLASEYNLEPSLVTAIVFVGTLLSPLTLTPLLVYLGR